MKRRITFLSTLFLLIFTGYTIAQSVNDPKHENHFKKTDAIETAQYKIEFFDVHAQQAFCQLKLTVTNKTNNYLIIKPEEFKLTFEHGTYSPKVKTSISSLLSEVSIIAPNKSVNFVVRASDAANFHVEKFDLEVTGIYLVSTDVEAISPEKFQLPANKNGFEAGGFKVELTDLSQRTQETNAKFNCTYVGDKIGVFDASKLVVSTDKGEYANLERKSEVLIMQKGDNAKFNAKFKIEGRILDMQFATMFIDWKDTFKESEKVLLESQKIHFAIDPGLTAGKNK